MANASAGVALAASAVGGVAAFGLALQAAAAWKPTDTQAAATVAVAAASISILTVRGELDGLDRISDGVAASP